MTVALSPIFQNDQTVTDANGDPRTGAKLFTYLAGSSTKVTTYQDSAGSVAHTNPIVLNSNGLPPAPVWLTTGATYKFVLAPPADTDPPVSAILTIDNITAINDTAAVTGSEWTAGPAPTYVSATSFTVAGDQTTVLHIGRRLKSTNTAGTVYSTIIKSVYTSLTTVTVLNDGSSNLDSGLSAVSYGIASADNTSLPFISRDQQCGRLVYVSATQIRLDPQDGNQIWVFTNSAWKRRTIPSAGITAANTNTYIDGASGQTLVAETTYYVYLFDNAGTLTLDFSTTAPAVDATSGLKIKTGVATRLLVGMARCRVTTADFGTPGQVLSWYKRRAIKVSASFSTTRTQTSLTLVEVNSEIQVKFLTWAEEAVACAFSGYTFNSVGINGAETNICIDGITSAESIARTLVVATTATAQLNASLAAVASIGEGYHYATIAGCAISGGTASWNGNAASGLSSNLYVLTQG